MNVLIVYAHPEPMSFDAKLKEHAVHTLKQRGYAVQVSDLYAMHFKAIVDPDDFIAPADETFFNLRTEQMNAALNRTFTPDILREQEKVMWANLIILQFPLWWYSFPAIMKGWIDRVMAYGFAYGLGRSLRPRRAMLVITTGGPTRPFTPELQESMSQLLHHIQRGTLRLCGLEVLPPFAIYGAMDATPEQREEFLKQYGQLLEFIDRISPLEFGD